MRLLAAALIVAGAVASQTALALGPAWGDRGDGMRLQREGPPWKKERDLRDARPRDDGRGGRMTPDQREQLRRDLDRANREIYHRKRRD